MLELGTLFKWHTEARYSTLHLKPCNFSEAISANLAIGIFIKKVSEGNCPLISDFDEVKTEDSNIIGVFRTKTGGTSKEPNTLVSIIRNA